ncbi:MAG TPA: DUF1643 domain-containing protein [Pirellulales bacterium]|jgi:hypothetical protein|nr:DUF1643 domain-containing protein [Pirellulales bacterium]HEX4147007.1 DUF1643 domain-containing protein [Pirellulales bacterium]
MVEFIPAEKLKCKFGVFGHFYSVQIAPKKTVLCRSVLEIVETDCVPRKAAALSNQKPDAIFIMMNPGSSRPLAEVDNRIHSEAIHELPILLVPTKPDTTQYQVMRIMHYCEWRHVRVLNLSDLRCANSGVFLKQFRELEEDHSFDTHTVFSDRRADELASKLIGGIPVIRAWGVRPQLDPLIFRCMSKLTSAKVVRGLLKEGTTNKFLHPLPKPQSKQEEWVNRMVEQCQG